MKKALVYAVSVILGLGAVIAGFLYIPDLLNQKKVDSAVDRMSVGSVLLKSVIEIENKTRKWPKDLSEIQAAKPEAFAVEPPPNFDGIEYTLVKNNGEKATYEFVYKGAKRSVTVTSVFGKQRGPAAAGMSTGSQ